MGLIQAGGGVLSKEESVPLLNLLPPEEVESVIKWQFTPDDLLEQFYYDMLGMVFDKKKNKWVEKYDAKINEKGARSVISTLRLHVSRVLSLSQFDEKEVNRIVRETMLSLDRDFFVNMEAYDLNINNAEIIRCGAEHLVLATVKGALRGGNRTLLSHGVRHVETFNQQPQNQGMGRLPLIGGLFR